MTSIKGKICIYLLHYFAVSALFSLYIRYTCVFMQPTCYSNLLSFDLSLLPSHVSYFIIRVPRLLSVRTRETLQPQIFRLQKSFQTNDAENNGKGTSDHQNNRKLGLEKMDNLKIPEYRNSNTAGPGPQHHLIEAEDSTDDYDDYFLAELHNSDPSDMRNKVQVVKLLAQMKSKEIETMNLESKISHSKKTNSKIDIIPQIRSGDDVEIILKMQSNNQGGLLQNTGKPSNVIVSPAVLCNHDTVSDINDHHITVKSLSKNKENENEEGEENDDNGDKINVTRIIVGNLDSFIDRYPYFMEKVNGWVKVSQPS